jgi:hypothetical protein
MRLGWGAQAAGLLRLAVRQTLRPTIFVFTKRRDESLWNEVFGGPPKTARGPRAVPNELNRSG